MEHAELALICSVALEAAPLSPLLGDPRPVVVGRRAAVAGVLAGREVVLLAAGMGKTNAAHGLTALLEGWTVAKAIAFGVGGAYPGSGMELTDLAIATEEIYADEGVYAPAGWLSPRDMGIPLLDGRDGPLYDALPMDGDLAHAAADALRRGGLTVHTGPFATVSGCSGTTRRGIELRDRHGVICETMEGAAYAHVAALYGVPLVEIRAISNAVEDRDLARWRLPEAAAAAGRAVEMVVGSS